MTHAFPTLRSSDLHDKFAAFGARRFLAALEPFGGAALEFLRQFLVEAFDAGEFLDRNIGDFFEFAETFGDEQLRERFVAVELFLEPQDGAATCRGRVCPSL